MMNSKDEAERNGRIAIESSGGKVMFHWLREPNGEGSRTVCGRYTFARHTGNEQVDEGTPECGVCSGHNIVIREANMRARYSRHPFVRREDTDGGHRDPRGVALPHEVGTVLLNRATAALKP